MILRFVHMLTHDVSTNAGAAILRCLSRMVVVIVFARSFTPEWFGVFVVLVGVETLLVCILSSVCTSPVPLIASGRSPRVRAAVMRAGDRMQLYLTAICVIIASPFLLILEINHPWFLVSFPCSIIALSAMNARRTDCTASFRSGRLFIAEIMIAICCIGSLLFPIAQPEIQMAVYWTAQSAAMIIVAVWINPNRAIGRVSPRLSRAARRMINRKGVDLLSGSVALSAQNRIQPILVAFVLGPVGAGMYGGMNMFAAPLRLGSLSIRSVYLPRISKMLRAPAPTALVSADKITLVVGILGIVCLSIGSSLVAEPLIRMVLGDEYSGSSNALPIAIFGAGLGVISTIMVCEMQALGKTNLTAKYRWVAALASLISVVPFMNMLGISGVFASIVLGELIMIVALYQSVSILQTRKQSGFMIHRSAMHRLQRGFVQSKITHQKKMQRPCASK